MTALGLSERTAQWSGVKPSKVSCDQSDHDVVIRVVWVRFGVPTCPNSPILVVLFWSEISSLLGYPKFDTYPGTFGTNCPYRHRAVMKHGIANTPNCCEFRSSLVSFSLLKPPFYGKSICHRCIWGSSWALISSLVAFSNILKPWPSNMAHCAPGGDFSLQIPTSWIVRGWAVDEFYKYYRLIISKKRMFYAS